MALMYIATLRTTQFDINWGRVFQRRSWSASLMVFQRIERFRNVRVELPITNM